MDAIWAAKKDKKRLDTTALLCLEYKENFEEDPSCADVMYFPGNKKVLSEKRGSVRILMTSLQLLPWTSEYHLPLENLPLKINLHSFSLNYSRRCGAVVREIPSHGPGQPVCWTFSL